jgi:ABC-type transporter Mla subunit MlaD
VTGTTDWPHLIFSVGAGVGVLLIGIGVLAVCSAIAASLRRLNTTLDGVDKQIAALSAPVAETLSHVGGIADTADETIARLGAVVGTLETLASGVGKTATLANDALSPAIVNLGATVTGLTAGLRRLVTGRRGNADNHNGGTSHE